GRRHRLPACAGHRQGRRGAVEGVAAHLAELADPRRGADRAALGRRLCAGLRAGLRGGLRAGPGTGMRRRLTDGLGGRGGGGHLRAAHVAVVVRPGRVALRAESHQLPSAVLRSLLVRTDPVSSSSSSALSTFLTRRAVPCTGSISTTLSSSRTVSSRPDSTAICRALASRAVAAASSPAARALRPPWIS